MALLTLEYIDYLETNARVLAGQTLAKKGTDDVPATVRDRA